MSTFLLWALHYKYRTKFLRPQLKIPQSMESQFFGRLEKENSNNETRTLLSRIQELCWLEPSQESLPFAFCQDTSLHGLKYVGQPKRHLFERLFWFSAFITGVVVACILINGVWEKYLSSPVIVSFQEKETRIEQIPFPAITICNVNNILRSKAHSFIDIARKEDSDSNVSGTALKNLYFLHHVCSSMALSFSQKFGFNANGSTVPKDLFDQAEKLELMNQARSSATGKAKEQTDVKNFLQENAQQCADMIHLCLWQDVEYNCTELFQPIETDFGKCCTFNMVPYSLLLTQSNESRDNHDLVDEWAKADLNVNDLLLKSPGNSKYTFPMRTKLPGSTYGLSILLNPALEEYFCATADGTGFQLATHLPTEVPRVVDYGIAIEFNKEIYITVTPDITTSDVIVKEIPLEKRRCYFDGEFSLRYYAFYTESNCLEECVANLTFQSCNCVRYYMPTDIERQLCVPSKLKCINEVRSKIALDGYSASGNCNKCLPTCTEINYVTSVTTSPIRNDVDIWLKDDSSTFEWGTSNVSIVHVYFAKGSTYPKLRKQLYGITDMIANTGGLLGLCLGFSVLSALEVLYFLTLRAWFIFRYYRRKQQIPNSLESRGQSLEDVKIFVNRSHVRPILPLPLGNDSSPYSEFILNELYTYYNKKTISSDAFLKNHKF